MSTTFAFDVTAALFSQAPQGFLLCGYDTGPGVAWTAAMWAAHPGAVHIAQQPALSADPVTADVLDVENGAATYADTGPWTLGAMASFARSARPGQRRPAIYCSASNVTNVANALTAAGVHGGVGLWIAKWDGNTVADIAALAAAAGPFPIIGFQYANDGNFDADVFSTAWLDDVSGSGWVFGPCRGVKTWAGDTTTFGVSGYSPGTPEKLGVTAYEVACSAGTQLGAQLPGYPAYVPKDIRTSGFSFTGHGLTEHKTYTVGVRAVATGGTHAGPWVTGQVTPGG